MKLVFYSFLRGLRFCVLFTYWFQTWLPGRQVPYTISLKCSTVGRMRLCIFYSLTRLVTLVLGSKDYESMSFLLTPICDSILEFLQYLSTRDVGDSFGSTRTIVPFCTTYGPPPPSLKSPSKHMLLRIWINFSFFFEHPLTYLFLRLLLFNLSVFNFLVSLYFYLCRYEAFLFFVCRTESQSPR